MTARGRWLFAGDCAPIKTATKVEELRTKKQLDKLTCREIAIVVLAKDRMVPCQGYGSAADDYTWFEFPLGHKWEGMRGAINMNGFTKVVLFDDRDYDHLKNFC